MADAEAAGVGRIGDDGGMSTPVQATEPQPTKRRGRENVLDMVRSLGLVMIVVVAAWWLAQPNDEDLAEVRPVDPAIELRSLERLQPGAPAPVATPEGWITNVAVGSLDGLRIGYITPDEQYLEYAISITSDEQFFADITGKGERVGEVVVGGVTWEQYNAAERDATSLVRVVGPSTVVVGGTRETGTLDQLTTLAGVISP